MTKDISNKTLFVGDWLPQTHRGSDVFSWDSDSALSCPNLLSPSLQDPKLVRDQVVESWHQIVRIVSDHVNRDRFVRFWMNPIVELSPYKSDMAANLAKISVLRRLLQDGNYDKLVFCGEDRRVRKALSILCSEEGITFNARRQSIRFCLKNVNVPKRLMALIYLLFHLIGRWPLRSNRGDSQAGITLVSYFAQLNWNELSDGKFHSYQWSALRDSILSDSEVNWVHHYVSRTGKVKPRSAQGLVESLRNGKEFHRFIDAELSLGLAVKALGRLLSQLLRPSKFWRLDRVAESCGLSPEWALVRGDCLDGLLGLSFSRNVLSDLLISRVTSRVAPNSTALVLWENQPWERAFARHWHNQVGGKVLSYAHTTVAFWSLPYFDWFMREINTGEFDLVAPDGCLVNGALSMQALLDAKQPRDRFTEVEALRYSGLISLTVDRKLESETKFLLALGEIRPGPTQRMLSCVSDACRRYSGRIHLVFKPHPACDPSSLQIEDGVLQIDERPLEELLPLADFVIACAGTTAVVEAAELGITSASFVASGELNLCPMVGWADHKFLESAEDVIDFLTPSNSWPIDAGARAFILDPELPRWSKLLSTI